MSTPSFEICVNNTLQWEYSVSCIPGLLDIHNLSLANVLTNKKSLLIITPTVYEIYGEYIKSYVAYHKLILGIHVMSLSEKKKLIEDVLDICKLSQEFNIGRTDLLIGMGGGVCTDLVTMAASMIRRGTKYIRIPTSLIGQIDASIGIKGAINFNNKKSYLGCFYPPIHVFIDPVFLATLPKRHTIAGFAEIIKMALIDSPILFKLLEDYSDELVNTNFTTHLNQGIEVLKLSITNMLLHLQTNFYENKTFQRYVDMGHTFSPQIETILNFDIQHGEAVAIDLSLSTFIALGLGLLSQDDCYRIITLIQRCSLPIYSPHLTLDLCIKAIDDAVLHRGGCLNLPVPTAIGSSNFLIYKDELPVNILRQALNDLKEANQKLNMKSTAYTYMK